MRMGVKSEMVGAARRGEHVDAAMIDTVVCDDVEITVAIVPFAPWTMRAVTPVIGSEQGDVKTHEYSPVNVTN